MQHLSGHAMYIFIYENLDYDKYPFEYLQIFQFRLESQ